jgi:hypothetical protein
MSFSGHKRRAQREDLPLSHRASSARSCAVLVSEKFGIHRSELIAIVKEKTGIDMQNMSDSSSINQSVDFLDWYRFNRKE